MTFPLIVITIMVMTTTIFITYSDAFVLPHCSSTSASTHLHVSIGLGPGTNKKEENDATLVEGIDYQVPNHEEYRRSRLTKLDEQADEWFQQLLGENNNDIGMLGHVAIAMKERLLAPVELVNEVRLAIGDENYTPYVNTKLPWTPLVPAFGLEQFGIPTPRRNAEAWRHFDMVGMIGQNYSGTIQGYGTNLELTDEHVQQYKETLMAKGGWLDDDACVARLVYVNGRFAPQLSKTTSFCKNMEAHDLNNPEIIKKLSRLTDGFTDELAVGVPSGKSDELTSFKALSKPNHCVGEATSQFAINGQQGTACFAALNTIKTGAVAYVQYPKGTDSGVEFPLPLLLVNAITKDCGADETVAPGVGVTCHPRALIVAEEDSRLSVVQSIVDLDNESVTAIPKLYNGYTQFFIHGNANVTHAYLEETGGIVIGGTEVSDEDLADGDIAPRTLEAARPALKDTHLEAIDAQVMGNEGSFTSTMISIGGSGRVRVALSVSLLRPGAYAGVNGFALTGGAQRTDMKTNIHHMGQRTISRQLQKNMIGGRATGSFRGRIRVEQSAQQTESQQISRTVLLSDRCRAWAVPSLEIVADDVSCTHGATVSDLSDEELFYLRSRGLSQATARNMLMYAFAGDITQTVDPSMLGSVDSKMGLQRRIIERLENLVPRGNRMVKGEFQSS